MAGDGSIYPVTKHRPDGTTYRRWIAQMSYGGRQSRRFVRRTCRTRAAARDELEELRSGARTSLSKQPLGTYLRGWLDERKLSKAVSPNTLRGYEDVIGHLAAIATIPIGQLEPEDIEHVLNRMEARRHHQRVATAASPKTRRNALLMLRAALRQAEDRGHLKRNPAALVELPQLPRRRTDAMTPERARQILGAVEADRYEAAFALALCGLRASEILGLSWANVDLERGFVRITEQVAGSGRRATLVPTKTQASVGEVPLPGFAVERLRAHRPTQLDERVRAGKPTEEGLVFVTPRGYAVNGSWLTRHFHRLLEQAGLPKLGLHSLRHGTADLLAGLGVHPSIAQAILRHASSRTTLDVYTSVTKSQEREAIVRYQEAIG